MHLLALLLLAAAPFWETKEVKDWSETELETSLTQSPWARYEAFLATAKPMQLAEAEWRRRHISKKMAQSTIAEDDYAEFMKGNDGKYVVLAFRIDTRMDLMEQAEIRAMEKESWMRDGKKKVKIVGHFPPTSLDPFLRIVFPRPVNVDKSLRFSVYVPGLTMPYRDLDFQLGEMTFNGKLEY